MTRRTLWPTLLTTLLLSTTILSWAWAAEVPVVDQLDDPTFTASERAALMAGIDELDRVLREGYPVPVHRLASAGWTDADFVTFVAGYLTSSGYETVVAEALDDGDATKMWVLAGIEIGERTVWVPVEATPALVGTSSRLGLVPWADVGQSTYEDAYVTFDRLIALPNHPTPMVRIIVVGNPVAGTETSIHAASTMSASVMAYVWTIEGDENVYVETHASLFRYVFPEPGTSTVTLVVYDRWGSRGTATKTVRVGDDPGCACH